MKTLITEIKAVVPKGMKVFAVIAIVAAALCATVFAFMSGFTDAHSTHPDMPRVVAIPLVLLVGTMVALWLLAMGYIYGDAKRRGMPAALWALHRFDQTRRPGWLAAFTAALIVQGLCASYYLLFFMVFVALWVLWFVRWRDWRPRLWKRTTARTIWYWWESDAGASRWQIASPTKSPTLKASARRWEFST